MPNRTPIRLREGEFVSTGQRAHETLTALPTMLCAARAQVVAIHYLLGVPELSKLQSATMFQATAVGARDSTQHEHLAPGCTGNFEGIGQRLAPWTAYKQKRPRLRSESWGASLSSPPKDRSNTL